MKTGLFLSLLLACASCAPAPRSDAPRQETGVNAPAAPATEPAAAPAPAAPPAPTSTATAADAGTAESDDIPTRLGLPALRPICAGNVPDVPRVGEPATDVAWAAFASQDGRAALNEHFDALFGRAAHLPQGACDSWRFPPQRPTSLLQVCAPNMEGPWSTCGSPPAGTGAVLIVSELAGAGAQ